MRHLSVVSSLLLLGAASACLPEDPPPMATADARVFEAGSVAGDHDHDGYTVEQGDCDDNDPAVRPGAAEICNDGKDNNCNGAVDTQEPDGDFDGFGPCQGDCNDRDQAVNPAAKEVPDGKDNNCDGVVDGDYDRDGFTVAQGDCDDDDPRVFPEAVEDCFDGKDNDCNGSIDDKEPDSDKDGYGPCGGDCNDNDPAIHPGAKEIPGDHKDNDCDYLVDADLDGDGWTTENGDCDDNDASAYPGASIECASPGDLNCNKVPDNQENIDLDNDGLSGCDGDCDDNDPARRPGFVELRGDGIDNDCDGKTDNVVECDCASGIDEAAAMDLCQTGVTVTRGGDPASRGILQSSYGAIQPREKTCSFFTISSGKAWDTSPQGGTSFPFTGNPVTQTGCMTCTTPGSSAWTHPGPKGCCEDQSVNDPSWVRIEAIPPVNAHGFKFDFIFLSSEYPEYVHSQFNDTFYAIEQSSSLTSIQNVSFDANGQPLTVNNGWFENPLSPTQSVQGTGYDKGIGSSSGWLTTTAPCTPGEKLVLTFWIHDEGDHILDSAVIIDNFRWVSSVIAGPSTIK